MVHSKGASQIWRPRGLIIWKKKKKQAYQQIIVFPKHMMNLTHTIRQNRFATRYKTEQRVQRITTKGIMTLFFIFYFV